MSRKKDKGARRVYLGVSLPAEMHEALKRRAAEGLHSLSAEVRLAVQGHLRRVKGEG